jgi:hypothetical protein
VQAGTCALPGIDLFPAWHRPGVGLISAELVQAAGSGQAGASLMAGKHQAPGFTLSTWVHYLSSRTPTSAWS